MRIDVIRPRSDSDWRTLETEWRGLENQADGSFFQSWTWVGCRARERFDDPFLLRASEARQVAGLALFNRRRPPLARFLAPTLWLHEAGRADEDSVFIEHNGPLLARDSSDLLAPMLAAALRQGRVVLSGVRDEVRDAAAAVGRCNVITTRPAPFARLADVDAAGWLAGLGSSTRYQLRRSRREYEASGTLTLQRATDVTEGLAFLAALAVLHQARWSARGAPGAFAEPAFMAFHRTLVARGLPRGEVDLLRVSVMQNGSLRPIGYLYNFRWRDRVYAYQAGFDYAAAVRHQAPGLTCHHLAIEAAIGTGCGIYDFLAGEARYKTSLGGHEAQMHWLELTSGRSLYGATFGKWCVLQANRLKRLMLAFGNAGKRLTMARVSRDSREMERDVPLSDVPRQRRRVAVVSRMPWPLAAAVMLALTLAGWVVIVYLIRSIF